jgi:hypothetical protein
MHEGIAWQSGDSVEAYLAAALVPGRGAWESFYRRRDTPPPSRPTATLCLRALLPGRIGWRDETAYVSRAVYRLPLNLDVDKYQQAWELLARRQSHFIGGEIRLHRVARLPRYAFVHYYLEGLGGNTGAPRPGTNALCPPSRHHPGSTTLSCAHSSSCRL